MINKIIGATFLVLLMFSLSLYLAGVRQVDLGVPFMAFLRNSSVELEKFKVSIPEIPQIPKVQAVNGFLEAVNGIIWFLNQLVNLFNFVITLVNALIQLVEFVFILLKNLITMKDSLIARSTQP